MTSSRPLSLPAAASISRPKSEHPQLYYDIVAAYFPKIFQLFLKYPGYYWCYIPSASLFPPLFSLFFVCVVNLNYGIFLNMRKREYRQLFPPLRKGTPGIIQHGSWNFHAAHVERCRLRSELYVSARTGERARLLALPVSPFSLKYKRNWKKVIWQERRGNETGICNKTQATVCFCFSIVSTYIFAVTFLGLYAIAMGFPLTIHDALLLYIRKVLHVESNF